MPWVLFIALSLAGCVASGPAGFKELPLISGFGEIYIFRESKFEAAGINTDIYVDGTKIGNLPNGSYLVIYASTAKHKVEARFSLINKMWYSDAAIELSVDDGKSVFAELDLTMTSLVVVGPAASSTWSTGFQNCAPATARTVVDRLRINNSNFELFVPDTKAR